MWLKNVRFLQNFVNILVSTTTLISKILHKCRNLNYNI